MEKPVTPLIFNARFIENYLVMTPLQDHILQTLKQ